MELTEIIIQKIKKDGLISFKDFMEMALYYPGLGYYTSAKQILGKSGDYYTSPVLSTIYGYLIGRQIEDIWQVLNKEPITIVEYGAGNGCLSFDILSYLKSNSCLYSSLNYFIIEKSSCMRRQQQTLLQEKVQWINAITDIPIFSGCVLSNEVVDNFSVHGVIMKEELKEVFVDYTNDFAEVLLPASEEIKMYLLQQHIILPGDYRTEINLQACHWIKDIARQLNKGFVITIDYGFLAHELYAPERKHGTLACYHKHRVNFLPYTNIGLQDITAHVNFTALHYWGRKFGLECTGFCNQHHFLRALGIAGFLREMEIQTKATGRETLLQAYKLLIEMGNKFKVLIQQKNISNTCLKGMQFATRLH